MHERILQHETPAEEWFETRHISIAGASASWSISKRGKLSVGRRLASVEVLTPVT